MQQSDIEAEAKALERLYQECLLRPFPYDDCRVITKQFGISVDDLIPDLDHYCATIAGYASSPIRLLRWSAEELKNAREALKRSFFDKYPQYKKIEPEITASRYPALYQELRDHESVRLKLLQIIAARSR